MTVKELKYMRMFC